MKKFFSIKKIIWCLFALSFPLMWYFIEKIFWNTAWERNWVAGIHNLQLFFVISWVVALITSLVHAWFTKRQWFILAALWVTMIMISFFIPLMELVGGNRHSFGQLLQTFIIVITVLLVIISLTVNYRLWWKLLLYVFIIFQIFQFYQAIQSMEIQLPGIFGLCVWLWFNILILTIITPSDKL